MSYGTILTDKYNLYLLNSEMFWEAKIQIQSNATMSENLQLELKVDCLYKKRAREVKWNFYKKRIELSRE